MSQPMAMRLLSIFTLLILTTAAWSSSGDRSQAFQGCVETCHSALCQPSWQYNPSLALRLTRWSCRDNCGYHCMHRITDQAIQEKSTIHQYYGKWPFWRFMGVQEPASTLFSMANFWVHYKGMKEIQMRIPGGHPLKGYYLNFAFVSMNAWVWSSVFHTRDQPLTEKLDYFSAAAVILYALYYTVVRLFHLYPSERNCLVVSPFGSRKRTYGLWGAICFLLFIGHVSYLISLPRFNYTYNMAFNLTIGVIHNLLWVLYALPTRIIRRFPNRSPSYRPHHAYKSLIFVTVTTLATSLELLDFPPWLRIIDAHSLWHLATVPIAKYWYDFLVQDALDSNWRGFEQ